MKLSERIIELIEKNGMTQKELAEKAGLAEITVRQYEAGKYIPKSGKLQRLADVFGVTKFFLENGEEAYTDENSVVRPTPSLYNQTRRDLENMPDYLKYLDHAKDKSINKYADLPEEAQKAIELFGEFVRDKYNSQDKDGAH